MLSKEKNEIVTRVGPGTPGGEFLRRYWHPIGGVGEFDERATRPLRLLGEDLVLYKDLSGNFGLIDRNCMHRRADLSYGMVEAEGLRCNYHGWAFDHTGDCVSRPYEDVVNPARAGRKSGVKIKAYPVRAKAGMLWAYLGPQPAPELPDWEPFSWTNGFAQVVLSEVPCNWFQCQENSIDPVHFEWMHENWTVRLKGKDPSAYSPTHTRLGFDDFEFGLTYRRIKTNTNESDPMWTIGRVCLWPNGFFLGEHFEWRVPIDDENTLSVTWKFTRVPKDREPYVQDRIPTWWGPVFDAQGRWIDSHVMNQDFLAWSGQGRIADRTKETLGASDQGIVMLRRRFFEDLERIAAGQDPSGLIRDPARNRNVELPIADRRSHTEGYTVAEILADPFRKMMFTAYIFQAGQPESVRLAFERAMGLQAEEYQGLDAVRPPETAGR